MRGIRLVSSRTNSITKFINTYIYTAKCNFISAHSVVFDAKRRKSKVVLHGRCVIIWMRKTLHSNGLANVCEITHGGKYARDMLLLIVKNKSSYLCDLCDFSIMLNEGSISKRERSDLLSIPIVDAVCERVSSKSF